jgi:hypothetical protein
MDLDRDQPELTVWWLWQFRFSRWETESSLTKRVSLKQRILQRADQRLALCTSLSWPQNTTDSPSSLPHGSARSASEARTHSGACCD